MTFFVSTGCPPTSPDDHLQITSHYHKVKKVSLDIFKDFITTNNHQQNNANHIRSMMNDSIDTSNHQHLGDGFEDVVPCCWASLSGDTDICHHSQQKTS